MHVMHIVRTVRSSTPAIPAETSNYDKYSPYGPYNTRSPYGSYGMHSREEFKVQVPRGSDMSDELAAADDIVKGWAVRHRKAMHKQGNNRNTQKGHLVESNSESENRSESQGLSGCECVGEREAECVCACTSWVPLGLLPLLCLEPSQAMDAIDRYGTTSFGSPSSSLRPTHTDAVSSVTELERMNGSEVHKASPPTTPSVMSQTIGKRQPSCNCC